MMIDGRGVDHLWWKFYPF